MTAIDEAEVRVLLKELQRMCKSFLKERSFEMYTWGYWIGILNSLDAESPHVVKTREDALYWRAHGAGYLMGVENAWGNARPEKDIRAEALLEFKQQIDALLDGEIENGGRQ